MRIMAPMFSQGAQYYMELAVRQLKSTKGGRVLFRNLSFTVRSGELVLIQGANGSGKSTLLRHLAGLSSAEKGRIHCNEQPILKNLASYRADIGFIGHQDGIHLSLTPTENIALSCALAELPAKSDNIQAVLAPLGLAHDTHKVCRVLSQGQRRKVALGALIAKGSPIWLLDEPLTALDADSIHCFTETLAEHLKRGGLCVMATHTALPFPKPHQVVHL